MSLESKAEILDIYTD